MLASLLSTLLVAWILLLLLHPLADRIGTVDYVATSHPTFRQIADYGRSARSSDADPDDVQKDSVLVDWL
ncbi:hypothetical protein [Thiocapsa sp.]|uniref:hypothetical protein n=1 Tax=Thiocapsa sp. TaxID=2024551 RepID=UPI0025D37450|nr:hypothetical protein [Thiocapsa sp.]